MTRAEEIKDEQEYDGEVIGMLDMFLRMVEDPTGAKVAEGWEADSDSMQYCLTECRSWLTARRKEVGS